MGKPAARLTDMHVCPMVTGVVPHVGGPVTGPGMPTVLIGGMPAAVMGDMCVCTGPPDVIILGSTGVLIGGKPAARMGDSCAHGGMIVLGCFTVLIGETMPGGGAVVVTPVGPVVVSSMSPGGSATEQMINNMPPDIKAQNATAVKSAEQGAIGHHTKAEGCPICKKNS